MNKITAENDYKIFKTAIDILLRIKEYQPFDNSEDFLELLGKVIALPYAYEYYYEGYEHEKDFFHTWYPLRKEDETEFHYFQDNVERVRHIIECYEPNNPILWTMIACLWYEEIGQLALSIYERDYIDDEFYIELGKIIKTTLEEKL